MKHFRNIAFLLTLALVGAGCQTASCPAYSKGYKKKQNDRLYAAPRDERTKHYRHKERESLIEWITK
jgi:hypothetical protein